MEIEELYRRHIYKSRCLVEGCKFASEPHHLRGKGLGGGTGLKPSDLSAIPLCSKHHRELHDIGIESFEKLHGLDLVKELVFCLWGFIGSIVIQDLTRIANETQQSKAK